MIQMRANFEIKTGRLCELLIRVERSMGVFENPVISISF